MCILDLFRRCSFIMAALSLSVTPLGQKIVFDWKEGKRTSSLMDARSAGQKEILRGTYKHTVLQTLLQNAHQLARWSTWWSRLQVAWNKKARSIRANWIACFSAVKIQNEEKKDKGTDGCVKRSNSASQGKSHLPHLLLTSWISNGKSKTKVSHFDCCH